MNLKCNWHLTKGKGTIDGNVRYNFTKLTPRQATLQHIINMIDRSSLLVFLSQEGFSQTFIHLFQG